MAPRSFLIRLVLVALGAGEPAAAANLTVTAVIPARAHLRPGEPQPVLVISQEDVDQGYVDASTPLPLHLQEAAARGLNLVLTMRPGPFDRLQVLAASAGVQAGAAAALIPVLAGSRGALPPLRIRFFLRPGAAPGSYPWPLQIGANF
ncbi:MAG TPA: hypothetical protein VEA40_27410 [Ramlibacter sp.]|nr:hypothetical protein [Ramlibacter sp.]